MTSRTGHVMATVKLHPLEERLREAQTAVVASANTELSSHKLASPVTADSKVVLCCLLTFFYTSCLSSLASNTCLYTYVNVLNFVTFFRLVAL